MEPDVLVRGELHIPEGVKLFGSKVNPCIAPAGQTHVQDLLNKYIVSKGGVSVFGYGATPAILERQAFFKVYDFFNENKSYVEDISMMCQTLSNYDVLLPVLFAFLGYTEIINDEIVECARDPRWEHSGKPLVHQYRFNYPKSNYDGRHAIV
jgi:hypothetical protein